MTLRDPRVLLLFAVLFGYILWPIVQVLLESVWERGEGFTLDPWRSFIERGHWRYGLRSLGISLATVVLSGAFGTGLAFIYFRFDFPGRGILAGLALLPFTLPPLVGVFAIWTMMAEDGIFHQATRFIFDDGLWFEKGYGGVLLVHVYSMYVFFYVLVGAALESFDETQIEAARDLGATRMQTFTRVVAPQLVPALAGASLLTFMTSMASFTAPFFYMAGRPVLTVGIQQALEESANGLASADCVVLSLCAGIFLFALVRFERTIEGGTRGAARRRVRVASRWRRVALTVSLSALTLVLLSPHLSMIRESLIKPGTGFIGVPYEYTFSNYTGLFGDADSIRPFTNSLQAAGVATIAVLAFTMLSAWLIQRREFAGKTAARMLLMLPWAMPGTVIAIGLLWISRKPGILTWGLNLRGTIAILALAYFIRLIPLAHRTIKAGVARVSTDLEGAARDLGASPFRAFLKVTFPLILPSVLAAATLTFATAMGEFVSSIILAGPGTEPISVKIDQIRRGPGGIHAAAAYSTILMLLITMTFILFGRRSRSQS